jgi:hypothetical protein
MQLLSRPRGIFTLVNADRERLLASRTASVVAIKLTEQCRSIPAFRA